VTKSSDGTTRAILGAFARPACWLLLVLCCSAAALAPPSPKTSTTPTTPTSPDEVKEYSIKAAFLHHFAKLTTWPDSAFEGADAPFVVGIAGDDPFGKVIDKVLDESKVGKRRLVVRRHLALSELASAHIVFVGEMSGTARRELFSACRGRPVLLIGDGEDFAREGGVAGFFKERGKVRFAINVTRVSKIELTMSSQLLKHAKIIK